MTSFQSIFFLSNQQRLVIISIFYLPVNLLSYIIGLVIIVPSYDCYKSETAEKIRCTVNLIFCPSKIHILYPFFSLVFILSCLSVVFSLELRKYLMVNKLRIFIIFCSTIFFSLAKYFLV